MDGGKVGGGGALSAGSCQTSIGAHLFWMSLWSSWEITVCVCVCVHSSVGTVCPCEFEPVCVCVCVCVCVWFAPRVQSCPEWCAQQSCSAAH